MVRCFNSHFIILLRIENEDFNYRMFIIQALFFCNKVQSEVVLLELHLPIGLLLFLFFKLGLVIFAVYLTRPLLYTFLTYLNFKLI